MKTTAALAGHNPTEAYHFSATIPFGVKPRMKSLPFPTSPKFAEDATAIRESKNGEYFTLYPLKPCVRYSSIVSCSPVPKGRADKKELSMWYAPSLRRQHHLKSKAAVMLVAHDEWMELVKFRGLHGPLARLRGGGFTCSGDSAFPSFSSLRTPPLITNHAQYEKLMMPFLRRPNLKDGCVRVKEKKTG